MGTSQTEAISVGTAYEQSIAKVKRVFRHPRILIFLLLLGSGLRVWAYVRETSLYLDEILLGGNILDLPLPQLLTRPLMLDQVAPRGFVLIERLAVMVFGPTEMALRLFPFACSIASVFFFWRLVQRTLTQTGSLIALFFFAVGVPFIRFGAEVKLYECDLLAAILLPLLLLELWDPRNHLMSGLSGLESNTGHQNANLPHRLIRELLAFCRFVRRDSLVPPTFPFLSLQ